MRHARSLDFFGQPPKEHEVWRMKAIIRGWNLNGLDSDTLHYLLIEFNDEPGVYTAWISIAGKKYLVAKADTIRAIKMRCTRHFLRLINKNLIKLRKKFIWRTKNTKPPENRPLLIIMHFRENPSIVIGYYRNGKYIVPVHRKKDKDRVVVDFWCDCLPQHLKLPKKVRSFYKYKEEFADNGLSD